MVGGGETNSELNSKNTKILYCYQRYITVQNSILTKENK